MGHRGGFIPGRTAHLAASSRNKCGKKEAGAPGPAGQEGTNGAALCPAVGAILVQFTI